MEDGRDEGHVKKLIAHQEGKISWSEVVGEKHALVGESEAAARGIVQSLFGAIAQSAPKGVRISIAREDHPYIVQKGEKKVAKNKKIFGFKAIGEDNGAKIKLGRGLFIGFVPRDFALEDGRTVPVYDRLVVGKIPEHTNGSWLDEGYENGAALRTIVGGKSSPFDMPIEVMVAHGIKGSDVAQKYIDWEKALPSDQKAKDDLLLEMSSALLAHTL